VELLAMELRDVNESQRLIVGVVAPYDEVSYLTPDPNGERIRRGAFAKSIEQRATKIPLLRRHDQALRLGQSREWQDDAGGLLGTFGVNPGDAGDALLSDCRDGYLGGLSAGWIPMGRTRGKDGVGEITEAKLIEVSAVAVPAYDGAALLAVRDAQDLDALLAPFRARPDVNLEPIAPLVYRSR
jgi:HK97 family phage prohead protease